MRCNVCVVITFSRLRTTRLWLQILVVDSWSFVPSRRSRLNVWSREKGSAGLSHISPVIHHIQSDSAGSILAPLVTPVLSKTVCNQNGFVLSAQSRVCQATQMRTDGVHPRESLVGWHFSNELDLRVLLPFQATPPTPLFSDTQYRYNSR